jgi:hypothetical protein
MFSRRKATHVFLLSRRDSDACLRGALRGVPAGVGSGIKNIGVADVFYGAREGRSPSP